MKIYLAGRYSIRDQLKEHRDTLHMLGHEVTSRWLDFEDENPDQFADEHARNTDSSHVSAEFRKFVAQMDVDDVKAAHVVMLFTNELGRRGGMFVEWGIGIALDKVLVLIGPEINVFQHYPGTLQFNSFKEALDHVDDWGERWTIFGTMRGNVEAGAPVVNNLFRGKAIESLRSGSIVEIDQISGSVRALRHPSTIPL